MVSIRSAGHLDLEVDDLLHMSPSYLLHVAAGGAPANHICCEGLAHSEQLLEAKLEEFVFHGDAFLL